MTALIAWPRGTQCRVAFVNQGDFFATREHDLVYSTVLGSCVSCCLFDPVTGIGGMNHFLLAEGSSLAPDRRYGVHAMELLINALLKTGASRTRLSAKIFGGARMTQNLSDIGMRNHHFARDFLNTEGLAIVADDCGGKAARRVNFHPATGQARVLYSVLSEVDDQAVERATPARATVTLF